MNVGHFSRTDRVLLPFFFGNNDNNGSEVCQVHHGS